MQLLPSDADEVRAMRHVVVHDRDLTPPWPERYAVHLEFPEPVRGPIALGYGGHFGLGVFIARD